MAAGGLDPTTEDNYWRSNYANRPYVRAGQTYDELRPAYEYGWQSRAKMKDQSWQDSEVALRRDWDAHPASSALDWNAASGPVRDAWDRGTLTNQNRKNNAANSN